MDLIFFRVRLEPEDGHSSASRVIDFALSLSLSLELHWSEAHNQLLPGGGGGCVGLSIYFWGVFFWWVLRVHGRRRGMGSPDRSTVRECDSQQLSRSRFLLRPFFLPFFNVCARVDLQILEVTMAATRYTSPDTSSLPFDSISLFFSFFGWRVSLRLISHSPMTQRSSCFSLYCPCTSSMTRVSPGAPRAHPPHSTTMEKNSLKNQLSDRKIALKRL